MTENDAPFSVPESYDSVNYTTGDAVARVAADPSMRRPSIGAAEEENLVKKLDKTEQKKIVTRCLTDYDADVEARSARMKKLKVFTELYSGVQKAKNFPFNNAANITLPVLAYPTLQIHARLFDMIWPENGKVFYSVPMSVGDFPRAYATEKFGNSYIRHRMPEMPQGLDDTCAQVVLYGSSFRRTYYDFYENRIRSDWIPIDDFVVNHKYRSQDPSMRDVPRYTLVQHFSLNDLEMYANQGVYENVDGIKADDGENDEEESRSLRATTEKIDGTDDSNDDTTPQDRPRMVLEQHRRWRLPNRPDDHPAFDGKLHYVIITIDEKSKRLLRVVLREENDPDDETRFAREEQAYQDFLLRLELWKQASANIQAAKSALPSGAVVPPMPEPPKEVPKPFPIRQRQIPFFTHYRAFPSEGFYGLGLGDWLAPLARAGSTLLNQHIDGVTLTNARPAIISRQLKLQRGSVNIQPGELIEADGPISAMKDGIFWLDPPESDPSTLGLVSLMVGMADKVAGSSEIMSGQTSGANRTAKEMQILNAQIMKQISVLARRVKEAFRHELDKIWRCWGTFLPEFEIMDIVNDSGQPERIPVSRKMFIPDARVNPSADPRMRFEKIEEIQQQMQQVAANPMLNQNPQVIYAMTQEMLTVFNLDQIKALVQPPQQPEPPQPMNPKMEEAGWLRNQFHPVMPQDNDDEHYASHVLALASPDFQMLSKEQREGAAQHLRDHMAQKHEKAARQATWSQTMMGAAPPQSPMQPQPAALPTAAPAMTGGVPVA
jgi:hypothetical protein